jgi:3-hydroxyacyl-[acyl-carrier-protein] dehydratase
VLGRINNAKFKQMVKPGDTLELEAELVERMGTAYFLKGRASVRGKTAVTVEYAVTLAKE